MTCYRSTQQTFDIWAYMGCVRAFGRDWRVRERETERERVCVYIRLNHAPIHAVLNQLDFAWIILVVSPRLT